MFPAHLAILVVVPTTPDGLTGYHHLDRTGFLDHLFV